MPTLVVWAMLASWTTSASALVIQPRVAQPALMVAHAMDVADLVPAETGRSIAIPIDINGQLATLIVAPGDDPEVLSRSFLAQHGYSADADDDLVAELEACIHRRSAML